QRTVAEILVRRVAEQLTRLLHEPLGQRLFGVLIEEPDGAGSGSGQHPHDDREELVRVVVLGDLLLKCSERRLAHLVISLTRDEFSEGNGRGGGNGGLLLTERLRERFNGLDGSQLAEGANRFPTNFERSVLVLLDCING